MSLNLLPPFLRRRLAPLHPTHRPLSIGPFGFTEPIVTRERRATATANPCLPSLQVLLPYPLAPGTVPAARHQLFRSVRLARTAIVRPA